MYLHDFSIHKFWEEEGGENIPQKYFNCAKHHLSITESKRMSVWPFPCSLWLGRQGGGKGARWVKKIARVCSRGVFLWFIFNSTDKIQKCVLGHVLQPLSVLEGRCQGIAVPQVYVSATVHKETFKTKKSETLKKLDAGLWRMFKFCLGLDHLCAFVFFSFSPLFILPASLLHSLLLHKLSVTTSSLLLDRPDNPLWPY